MFMYISIRFLSLFVCSSLPTNLDRRLSFSAQGGRSWRFVNGLDERWLHNYNCSSLCLIHTIKEIRSNRVLLATGLRRNESYSKGTVQVCQKQPPDSLPASELFGGGKVRMIKEVRNYVRHRISNVLELIVSRSCSYGMKHTGKTS